MLMYLFRASIAASALVVMAAVTTPVQAQEPAMPPLTKQINNGNWLPQKEAEALRDELFYQQAVHAYMTMLPALNVIGMRDGSEAAFGKGYNVLPIWKDRMDSRTWVPTPNADVIYSMSYLDLRETGPLVVAARRMSSVCSPTSSSAPSPTAAPSVPTGPAADFICCCCRATRDTFRPVISRSNRPLTMSSSFVRRPGRRR